ncbi:MAG: hypothetical protein H6737_22660 [Alphaproteobacteria bacterium]|nr:hypothetical protein [Alphaproteobacteria bacterium]
MLWLVVSALAASGAVDLEIVVRNAAGDPIPEATVHNSLEANPQRVNRETGTWRGNASFLDDGSVEEFRPGQTLGFTVKAAGYEPVSVVHEVKRKNNVVEVKLTELDIDVTDDPGRPGGVMFRGDKPLDR